MASKVDTSDPNVRRAVYSMYRGILGNYNEKANSIVNTLPKHRVRQDEGIDKQLESMMRQSNQIAGGGTASPSPGPPPGAPPPPPPYAAAGSIPSVRIPTEMSCRKEPPAAIQNAMMTKDKKPFTYTPGGLDLAEIRSPRMAKRISRNAHIDDRYDQPEGLPYYPQQMPVMQQPQAPMVQHQMAQGPRGWSPVNTPPVQSRSFRVLQKITGSDQEEAPVYSEMMSPPVYSMPPSYPPHFYSMRSPPYDNNGHPGESEY